MNAEELKRYRNGMFADRADLNEALNYAYNVARASDSPIHVITAIHVVLNTIINELEEAEAVTS
jgi:hypothetical protein